MTRRQHYYQRDKLRRQVRELTEMLLTERECPDFNLSDTITDF